MLEGIVEISEGEFASISKLVYSKFGINLSEKKVSLVKGRLNKYLHEKGFGNFSDYYASVVADTSGRELLNLVDKISTNHTFFYREPEHFNLLRQEYLPEWARTHQPDALRLWCAGCASGEEAYTLAITVSEAFPALGAFTGPVIFANDISTTVLETAKRGVYPHDRIRNLPKELILKYFTRIGEDSYQVKDRLKQLVLFRRMNFIQDDYPFKHKFDFVFFRNVMIYFDNPTKQALLEKIHRHMKEGSYLFIGHSESLGRDQDFYHYIQPAVYERMGRARR